MSKSIWSSVSGRISIIGGFLPDPDLATQKTVLVWLEPLTSSTNREEGLC
jgi:hypothetical protein